MNVSENTRISANEVTHHQYALHHWWFPYILSHVRGNTPGYTFPNLCRGPDMKSARGFKLWHHWYIKNTKTMSSKKHKTIPRRSFSAHATFLSWLQSLHCQIRSTVHPDAKSLLRLPWPLVPEGPSKLKPPAEKTHNYFNLDMPSEQGFEQWSCLEGSSRYELAILASVQLA